MYTWPLPPPPDSQWPPPPQLTSYTASIGSTALCAPAAGETSIRAASRTQLDTVCANWAHKGHQPGDQTLAVRPPPRDMPSAGQFVSPAANFSVWSSSEDARALSGTSTVLCHGQTHPVAMYGQSWQCGGSTSGQSAAWATSPMFYTGYHQQPPFGKTIHHYPYNVASGQHSCARPATQQTTPAIYDGFTGDVPQISRQTHSAMVGAASHVAVEHIPSLAMSSTFNAGMIERQRRKRGRDDQDSTDHSFQPGHKLQHLAEEPQGRHFCTPLGQSTSCSDVDPPQQQRNCSGAQASNSLSGLIEARDRWQDLLSRIPKGRHAIRWLPPLDVLMRTIEHGLDPYEAFKLRQMYATCHTERARGGGGEQCRQFLAMLRGMGTSFVASVNESLSANHLTPPTPPSLMLQPVPCSWMPRDHTGIGAQATLCSHQQPHQPQPSAAIHYPLQQQQPRPLPLVMCYGQSPCTPSGGRGVG